MKRFITVSPLQGAGNLSLIKYNPKECKSLEYGPTRFPIIPVINGYTDEDDGRIDVIVLQYDTPSARNNTDMLEDELRQLTDTLGIAYDLTRVAIQFEGSDSAIKHCEDELIARIQDNDVLHACITFGLKPITLAIEGALHFGYELKSNVRVECIVYGELDHNSTPQTAVINDITNTFIRRAAATALSRQDRRIENPKRIIDGISDSGSLLA